MEKPDYSCQKAGNNAARCFVSLFQRHLFFDKVPETVSDMLVGTYGKEYTFYQLCFPYPLVAFAGCGNRQHSGHCFSEIAFTDQSTRTGWGIQPGEPGALRFRIVHRDGQCTLSLVWTQRTKERFYCKVWQVCFADCLSIFLACSVSLCTCCRPVAAISYVLFYIFMTFINDRLVATTVSHPLFLFLSVSPLYTHFFSIYSHFLLTHSPTIQFLSMYWVTLPNLYHWVCENLAQIKGFLMFQLKWREDMKDISVAIFWFYLYSIKYFKYCAENALQEEVKNCCQYWYNCFLLIVGISTCWMSPLICDSFSAGAHQMMWRLSVFNSNGTHCCLPQSHHIALGKLVLWF